MLRGTVMRNEQLSMAFFLFAALWAVTYVFVWRLVPETKCRLLEEINGYWKRRQQAEESA